MLIDREMDETTRQCFAIACLAGVVVLLRMASNNSGSSVALPTIMAASPKPDKAIPDSAIAQSTTTCKCECDDEYQEGGGTQGLLRNVA